MLDRTDHPRLARQVGAREGAAYNYEGERVMLRRDAAGAVDVPSGQIVLGDPYAAADDAVRVRVPPGSYPVYVTSFRGEYAEIHERIPTTIAVRLRESGGVGFAPLSEYAITDPAEDPDDPVDDDLHFVGIDKAVCYVADRDAWNLCHGVSSASAIADVAGEVRPPGSALRVVCCASGLGGGGYPVFGGFDADGELAVIYLSFDLVFEGEPPRIPWLEDDIEDGALPSL